ncbi:hypothetical protein OMP43_09325 [Sphingomonas sp. CBMAI 2297]|uniref:hypothetical protein n=1 Tax=Sphingomonas sp. CBMAI 2297 TaxID=2991720 RepID=UPI0024585F87|nr:hypothetical protein [Sphingomonas sp. CBMAI 2297]MDH4744215.1 hypothetical protein [Sphingomonas sp. CBMAI 2297]
MPILITACTKKKMGDAQVSAADIPAGPIEAVGSQWIAAISADQERTLAARLYQGGSHAESRRAAEDSGYPHLIVSAGLGLIAADAEVPNYAASVLAGEDDILAKLGDNPDASHWWRWLQGRSPFAQSLKTAILATDGPCLIALPRPYLDMIEADLLSLPEQVLDRVRLFCGAQAPAALAHLQMPYDDRLDGPDSPYRGTRSNFASRALRHFATRVLPGKEGHMVAQHTAAVQAALAGWTRPIRTSGIRKSDAELREILAAHWEAMGGRSTRMLRLLRDELGIACEQGRFAALIRDMREERNNVA